MYDTKDQPLPPEPGEVSDPTLGDECSGDLEPPAEEPEEPTEINDEEEEEDDG